MAPGDAVISGHDHPSAATLEQPELDEEARAHLERCAACRVDRRVLLDPGDAGEPGPSTWAGIDDAERLVGTWLSSRDLPLPAEPSPVPRAVGRYVVDAVLGSGGQAIVYRAFGGGRSVAVKVLTRPDPELRARLRREGALQQALHHANVVRVHEILDVGGEPALVMDYVAGPSLHAFLRAGVPPLEVADQVARELLAGVAAAHRAGIVHRDLKPGNVLLQPAPDGFSARVTDFGLARGPIADDSLRTRTGTVAGTPTYMAPEQLRDASKADLRADVFSLGAILYELVSGLRAFAGFDYVDVVRRIADARYAPLPTVAAWAPERMVRAVDAALRADPADRPRDATELSALWSGGEAYALAPWPARLRDETAALHQPRPVEAPRDVFVGRQADLAALTAAFERERLVTLTGPGGVGKTRLALEAGRALASTFPGGVVSCDLSGARGVDGIVRAVARELRAPPGADPIERLGQALHGRGRVLVLLDNFEQVVEHAAATVEVWLDRAPGAAFLVTSREPLDLLDELAQPVAPLDPATDALALFEARAAAACPGFRLGPANGPDAAALVAELDGLPLAIEIAAARVRSDDVGTLLRKLRPRLHALPARDGSVPDRQRTLQATLDWSWDLLSVAEREALAQVSVFAGGFTAAAAEAVVVLPPGSPPVPVVLGALCSRSLLRERERYDLLVVVREYARRRLDELGTRADAEARHVAWYAANTPAPPLDDRELEFTRTLGPEADNYVVACRRALRLGRPREAAALCRTALPLLSRSTPVRTRIALIEEVLEAAPDDLDAARLRMGLGTLQVTAGDPDAAVRTHEQALAVVRREGSQPLLAQELNQLGLALWSAGRSREATPVFEESVQVAAACGARVFEGYSLGALAVIAQGEHRWDDALALFARAAEAHRSEGNTRGEALVLGDVGAIHHLRGDLDLAIPDLERSLQLLRALDDRQGQAVGLCMLADARMALDQPDAARELLTMALAIAQAVGAAAQEASVLYQLALVEQDDEAAALAFERALAAARRARTSPLEGSCLAWLAALRARAGARERAESLLADALRIGVGDQVQRLVELDLCRAVLAGPPHRTEHLRRAAARLAEAGISEASAVGRRLARHR